MLLGSVPVYSAGIDTGREASSLTTGSKWEGTQLSKKMDSGPTAAFGKRHSGTGGSRLRWAGRSRQVMRMCWPSLMKDGISMWRLAGKLLEFKQQEKAEEVLF